jgi:phosphohistidine phosphatase
VKLYVMRHGPAEDKSASGQDEDRALTPSGRDRVRSVARVLVDEDEAPLSIASSPLARALQTAEIVAAAMKLSARGGSVEVRRELAPGGDGAALVRALLGDEKKRCLIVGHEPDLSDLIVQLVGEPSPVPMDKAMVVGISVKPDGASLRFILDPKALALTIDLREARP